MYFFDFCWVACILYLLFGISCIGTNYGVNILIPSVTLSSKAYLSLFGISNGILGCSALMFNNAMVFHSIEHMAVLFIHGSPPLLSWTLRWYSDKYIENWDGILGNPAFYP